MKLHKIPPPRPTPHTDISNIRYFIIHFEKKGIGVFKKCIWTDCLGCSISECLNISHNHYAIRIKLSTIISYIKQKRFNRIKILSIDAVLKDLERIKLNVGVLREIENEYL